MNGFTASTSAMCQQRPIPLLLTNDCADMKAAALFLAIICDWHDCRFWRLEAIIGLQQSMQNPELNHHGFVIEYA